MTNTTSLDEAIGRLKHVYMQTDDSRQVTTETFRALAEKIAPDEFGVYQHHFNNTVVFFHNEIKDLCLAYALEDADMHDILSDAVSEISGRVIDDIHHNPTDMRGYPDAAEALADEIHNKLRYLKDEEEKANAIEMIGELREIRPNAEALVTALNHVIALLPPNRHVDAPSARLEPTHTQQQTR